MNILLISYGDYNYDGRLRELIKAFSKVGDLQFACRGDCAEDKESTCTSDSYFKFIIHTVNKYRKAKAVDVLVLDNRKATIPGLILRQLLKPKVVIQDCRELYVSKEIKHFTGKVGCFFEKIVIKLADIIICANKNRADIMKDMYNLKTTPIVYENLRKLEYSTEGYFSQSLSKYINPEEYRIVSSSGCSVSRTNDVLISNVDKVNKPIRVFLVGNSTKEDVETAKKIINDKGLKNVEILGTLNQDDLKWLIRNSHIGIVNYHQNDLNNKYCASGKLYEFIYEGIPVVTTTNPPLKALCDEYKVGEATDSYYDGINVILDNYDEYTGNVKSFSQLYTVDDNNERLINEIKAALCKH